MATARVPFTRRHAIYVDELRRNPTDAELQFCCYLDTLGLDYHFSRASTARVAASRISTCPTIVSSSRSTASTMIARKTGSATTCLSAPVESEPSGSPMSRYFQKTSRFLSKSCVRLAFDRRAKPDFLASRACNLFNNLPGIDTVHRSVPDPRLQHHQLKRALDRQSEHLRRCG
jgi:hypothetical protein